MGSLEVAKWSEGLQWGHSGLSVGERRLWCAVNYLRCEGGIAVWPLPFHFCLRAFCVGFSWVARLIRYCGPLTNMVSLNLL